MAKRFLKLQRFRQMFIKIEKNFQKNDFKMYK